MKTNRMQSGYLGSNIARITILQACLFKLAIFFPLQVAGLPGQTTLYNTSTFGLYDIATFDVYTDRKTIHVIVGGRKSQSDHHITIRYIRSENGGRHWSRPVTVNQQPMATHAKRGNDIQLAAWGRHLVILMQGKNELPGMGPMISLYSSDDGKSWQRGTNPAKNDLGSQAHIDLVADHKGRFHVAWLEDPEEKGHQSLRYTFSVNSGKHWKQPQTIDDTTCSCCWNTFAQNERNRLNVLYRGSTPRDMKLTQSIDDGINWRRIGSVGDFNWQLTGCPHTGGGISYVRLNEIDVLHSIVWTGAADTAGLYHLASINHGRTWSAPERLGNRAINGDIAGYEHRLVAIWNEMEANGMSVVYAETADHGSTWSGPISLAKPENATTQPRVTVASGEIVTFWTENPPGLTGRLAWKIIEPRNRH